MPIRNITSTTKSIHFLIFLYHKSDKRSVGAHFQTADVNQRCLWIHKVVVRITRGANKFAQR